VDVPKLMSFEHWGEYKYSERKLQIM